MKPAPLSWIGIVRLGLVQTAIGAVFALTSRTLNRVMVVEYAVPAMLPAGFIAWNYAVQLSRARWGHGSDQGGARGPWIMGGMGVMALGAIMATDATTMIAGSPVMGILLALFSYTLIGLGVGAAGTSLLALLAVRVAPARRPAAAAIAWIMMIVGFILYAIASRAFLEPFSAQRLALVASFVAGAAFVVACLAVRGMDGAGVAEGAEPVAERPAFKAVLAETWADPLARRFTIFVFISMLAYSVQELILEPYAGLVFGLSPAASAQLTGMEQGGALIGMVLVGALGARFGDRKAAWMKRWNVLGCAGSAFALAGLAAAAIVGSRALLTPATFLLGLANGVFAVSAIGSMMGLAGAGKGSREGARMGVWGAAQAAAFAVGGFLGAVGVEALRGLLHAIGPAFVTIFAVEAALFLVSAVLAARLGSARTPLESGLDASVTFEGAH